MSQNKKIIITLPSLAHDPGGVAHYYNAILPYLKNLKEIQIDLYELGGTHGEKKRFHQLSDQLRFIKNLAELKPDLVHVNPSLNFKSFLRDGMIIFWAKRKKIPTLVFFRGWERQFETKIKGGFLWFFNRTYKRADIFIVLASEFKTALRQWGVTQPVLLSTTAVNESLVQDFSISRKVKKLARSQKVRILFLSRLERQKGVFETIDAFELLLQRHRNISLTIAGDGRLFEKVKNRIKQKKMSPYISLPGYVTGAKKTELLSSHDIYCFPTSYGEGMPNSLLEAMAFGMVIVTTPVGGIKDFFRENRMGTFCHPHSPQIIAEKIETYLDSKKEMVEVAEFNHAYAKAHFMGSAAAGHLKSIYRRLLF